MRKGKQHGDKGEVSVHLSPRNPVTLNSTFIRFVNRPRGKVLGADQRAELRSREEVQIRPQSARDFVWTWSGWGGGAPAVRGGGEPPNPAGAGARLQRAAGGGRAAGPSCALKPRSTPGAWSCGGAGSRLPPHPALCPSASGGRPLAVPKVGRGAALTALGPSKDCEPASPGGHRPVALLHPGGTQQGGDPRTLALPAEPPPPPPPPEVHAGRGQAQKASDSETHTIPRIPLLPKNSRRNAP